MSEQFIVPITRMTPLSSSEEARGGGLREAAGSLPFADVLKNAVQTLQEQQQKSDEDAYDLAIGNTDNLAGLMIQSAKLETALTMTVQLTSRAVNAYKEIMQMQV